MRIAVAGGTGTIGRRIAAALSRDGHEVRVLSRRAARYPVDLTTGSGLQAALAGCDVVVDASNGPPSRKARAVLVDGSRRLLEVEASVGVGHHVCVSIVGIDDVPMTYYRVKLEQERVVQAAGVPWTIVRATQVHDLLGSWLSAAGRRHVLPAARARFQPVAADQAADAVAGVATDEPRLARVTVAGPEVHDLRSLGRMWRERTGRRALEIPIPLPGRLGRALREGRLTCPDPDVRGTQTFASWLQANAD
ncbi:MAG TPA: NAD(P)H-binding protein [Solirubrobacteraceae bacterium]|jgi:uncharacterized protein YbjT (DUF2867 family)